MYKDERLELLSDKIRQGIPVGLREALEVIDYQDSIKRMRQEIEEIKRSQSFFTKLKSLFKGSKQDPL